MIWLYWARIPFLLLLVTAVFWIAWLAREHGR